MDAKQALMARFSSNMISGYFSDDNCSQNVNFSMCLAWCLHAWLHHDSYLACNAGWQAYKKSSINSSSSINAMKGSNNRQQVNKTK